MPDHDPYAILTPVDSSVVAVDGLASLSVDGYDLSILDRALHAPPSRDGSGRVSDSCSTPDPTKYHAAGQQFTSIDGSPLSAKMRPGRYGLEGTVVPRATYFGGSQGWNPHRPPSAVVHVFDPTDPRGNFDLDLSKVTQASAAKALAIVEKHAGAPKDIEALRAKQAATFYVLRQMEAQAVPRAVDPNGRALAGPPPAAPQGGPPPMQFGPQHVQPQQPQQPQPQPQQQVAQPPSTQYMTNNAGFVAQVDPMAVFASQPGAATSAPAHVPSSNGAAALPPRQKVTIGVAGFGNHEASFHSVERVPAPDGSRGILILGIETAYDGHKFIPDSAGAPLAVHVHGWPTVLKVESMGFRHVHKGELLIYYEVLDERPVK